MAAGRYPGWRVSDKHLSAHQPSLSSVTPSPQNAVIPVTWSRYNDAMVMVSLHCPRIHSALAPHGSGCRRNWAIVADRLKWVLTSVWWQPCSTGERSGASQLIQSAAVVATTSCQQFLAQLRSLPARTAGRHVACWNIAWCKPMHAAVAAWWNEFGNGYGYSQWHFDKIEMFSKNWHRRPLKIVC